MQRLAFLDIPLVGAPMAGVTTPDMVAAISNEGGLGSLACGYLRPDAMQSAIAQTRAQTTRPFAINLFVPSQAHVAPETLARANAALARYREELRLALDTQPDLDAPDFDEQVQMVLHERPAVFSFTFGIPHERVLAACRELGIFTIGTATSLQEALALETAGVDAVCVQGYEAGGHRGAFLHDDDRGLIGTIALTARVTNALRIPVIAAGGIGDGRGVAAVLALGAVAAQVGSAFLLAIEAATPQPWRALVREHPNDTTITSAFSGRAARGVRNRFMDDMRDAPIAPYPIQHALTREIRSAAAAAGNGDLLSPWAGQAVGLAREAPTTQIVRALIDEARTAVGRCVF